MRSLGKDYDLGSGIMPVDLTAGANTGHRVHMRNAESLAVVLLKAAASGGTDNVVLTLQEHNAATGGTSQTLAAIGEFYVKSEAAPMDGDESWVEVSNLNAGNPQGTLTLAGATYAAQQAIVVFEIEAASLSAGFEWLSVNIADPSAANTLVGSVLYIANKPRIQRRPDLLAQLNA